MSRTQLVYELQHQESPPFEVGRSRSFVLASAKFRDLGDKVEMEAPTEEHGPPSKIGRTLCAASHCQGRSAQSLARREVARAVAHSRMNRGDDRAPRPRGAGEIRCGVSWVWWRRRPAAVVTKSVGRRDGGGPRGRCSALVPDICKEVTQARLAQ